MLLEQKFFRDLVVDTSRQLQRCEVGRATKKPPVVAKRPVVLFTPARK
jgi:hypothetical protein